MFRQLVGRAFDYDGEGPSTDYAEVVFGPCAGPYWRKVRAELLKRRTAKKAKEDTGYREKIQHRRELVERLSR